MQSNRFFSGNIDHLEVTARSDNHIYLPPQPTLPPASKPTFRNIHYYTSTSYEVALQEKLSNQKDPIKQAVIYGTAGSGKTVLAEQLLARYQHEHPEYLTYKLLAETKEQWESSLRTCAEALHPGLHEILKAEKSPDRQKQLIVQAIQNALREKTWCILIDNWDIKHGPALHEVEQIFCLGNGTLLITTQACPETKKVYSLDLSFGFSQEESQELLLKVMNFEGELKIGWEALGNEIEFHTLTQILNRLPLALVLAGSYLLWENKSRQEKGKTYFTFQNYQELLSLKVTALVEEYDKQLHDKGDIPRDITRDEFVRIKTQEMAVDLSLQKTIQVSSLNPNVNLWQVLCFCGFLASDGIPQQLLKDYLQQLLNKPVVQVEEYFDQMIDAARRYSLLQLENTRSIVDNLFGLHIHRVVQHVLRDNYWDHLISIINSRIYPILMPPIEKSIYDMIKTWEIYFNENVQEKSFLIIQAYHPHIESWLMYSQNRFVVDIRAIYHLHSNSALAHVILGNLSRAEVLFKKILPSIITCVGEQHESVITMKQNLAGVLAELGRHDEAKELQLKMLDSLRQNPGNDPADLAIAEQNLANTLEHSKQYTEEEYRKIEELHRSALDRRIANATSQYDINVAIGQQNLAITLENRGFYKEAEELYRKALFCSKKYYKKEDHLDVALVQGNLAGLLVKTECYVEAEELFNKALVTQEKYYTKNHAVVAKTQQNLAMLLELLNRFNEAEVLYREALDIMKSKDQNEHRAAIASLQQNLAILLTRFKFNQYAEAEELYNQAIATKSLLYGEKHIEVARTKQNLAQIYTSTKRFQLAFETLDECEYIFKTQIDGQQYLEECYYCRGLVQQAASYCGYSATSLRNQSVHQVYEPDKMLHRFAGEGHYENLVSLLTKHPELLDAIDQNLHKGWTALHWAVQNNRDRCVEELLKLGAQYDIADKTSQTLTAVDICILEDKPSIKKLFFQYIYRKYIEKGVNQPDEALRMAANRGRLVDTKIFIAENININSIDIESGKTALHLATQKRHLSVVRFLIGANADITIEDYSRKKAIEYANGDKLLMDLFLNEMLEVAWASCTLK